MKHLIQNVSYKKGRQVPLASFFGIRCKNLVTALFALTFLCGASMLHAQSQDLSSAPTCETGTVSFTDISVLAGATDIGQGDDVLISATLPFSFSIGGETASTSIDISTNGTIANSGFGSSDLSNSCPLPDAGFSSGALIVYHDDVDMQPGSSSSIWTMSWSAGAAGHPGHPTAGTSLAAFMIHWNDAQDFPGATTPAATDVFDFAAVLYEDGSVVYLYDANMVNADQGGATVGIQSLSGASQTAFSCNSVNQINCNVLFFGSASDCDLTLQNCPISAELNADLNCTTNLPSIPDYSGSVQFDNPCGLPVTFSQVPAAGTQISAGQSDGDVINVIVTLDDGLGNTYDCAVDVTLNDFAGPQIDCLTDQTITIQAADCATATVPDFTIDAMVSNGCSGTISQSPVAGTLLTSLGVSAENDTYTVTITADDGNGNTASCPDFTVTMNFENTFTLGACPANVSVSNDLNDCGAVVNYVLPTVTDNCTGLPGGATLTQIAGLSSGSSFPLGTTTNTFVAMDADGEKQECSFTVTVTDDEAPSVLSCPPNLTGLASLNTNASDCNFHLNYALPVFEDNCGIVSMSLISGLATDTDFPVGLTTVTYRAFDAAGNFTDCSFDVRVVDERAPVALNCPTSVELSFNLNCNDPNTPVLPDYTALPGFTDNCGLDNLTQSPAAGSALNTIFPTPFVDGASINVTVTATDAEGNSEDCTFSLTLNDHIGPHIACPGDQVVYTEDEGDGMCNISLPDFTGLASAGVLCGNAGLTSVTQVPLPTAGGGITYTAGDVITITLTASDGNGNTESCTFEASFEDNTAPILLDPTTCVDPADALLGAGECLASVVLTPPSIMDNCDANPIIIGLRHDGGAPLTPENFYTGDFSPCSSDVSWYAIDADGNESDTLCTVTVTVTEPDNQLNQPTANCVSLTIGLNDNGEAIVCAEDVKGTSGDACTDNVTYQIAKADGNGQPLPGEPIVDCITFTCADLGQNFICLKVTDCSGNDNFCTASVVVEDKRFPYIECPGDIQIECDMDNDGDPLPYDMTIGLPAHLPNYPQANAPVDLAVIQAWANAGYGIGNPSPEQNAATGITGLPLAYDNCGATISYVNEYFYYNGATRVGPVDYNSTLPINDPHECEHHNYEIERTWTVVDAQGQSASCTQLIVVMDTQSPVILANGVADATLECSDVTGLNTALSFSPTADDNCYLASFGLIYDNSGSPEVLDCAATGYIGRITRTWEAVDACGNTETLTQIINLQDTTDPTLSLTVAGQTFASTAGNAVSVNTDLGHCDASVDFSLIMSDNCDADLLDDVSLLVNGTPSSFELNGTATFSVVLEKGTNTITVTVTDDCGNDASVQVDVNVIDNEAPAFADCTEDTYTFFTSDADVPVNEVNTTDCAARVRIEIPPFQDNCPLTMGAMSGSVNMSLTLATGTSLNPGQSLYPYTLGWVDVTADANQVKQGPLPVGLHTVEFQMIDASGNTSTICSYDINVIDDQDPLLTCPGTIILNLSDDAINATDCQFSFVDGVNGPVSILPTVSDNCQYTFDAEFTGATAGTFTAITLPDGLDIDLNVGATSILYQATDNTGNTVQCSFTIVVTDDIDPTITCPASITDVADAGVCYKTVDVTPAITDNCEGGYVQYTFSGATNMAGTIAVDATGLTSNILSAIDANVGITDVTYTYVDAEGNSHSCSFDIEITDTQAPALTCVLYSKIGTSGTVYDDPVNGIQQADASLPFANGDCSATVPWLTVTAVDNCCVSSIQYQIINATTSEIVEDWVAVMNEPLPADGDQTLSLSHIPFEKGMYTVNIRTWDCHMLEEVCSMTVEVIDDEKPAFTDCPSDITVNQLASACLQTVDWTEPTQDAIVDNCSANCPIQDMVGPWVSFDADEDEGDIDGDINIISQSNGDAFATFPVGTRYVKYYVEDEAGNRTYCIFSVEVVDNIAPSVVSCPSTPFELIMDLDCNNVLTLDDYTNMVEFSDICGVTSVTQSIYNDPMNPVLFTNGGTVVDGQLIQLLITASDAANQTAECIVSLVINDNVGPYIACPSDQTLKASDSGVVDANCMVSIPDFTGMATAGVLCGNEQATVTQSPAMNSTFSSMMFPMSVTLTATDASGNSTQCSFSLFFVDDVAPELVTCGADPADGLAAIASCSAMVTLTPPTVSDCAVAAPLIYGMSDTGVMLTASNGYQGSFPACTSVVTWHAVDMFGNSAEICTNTVTVYEPLNEANEPTAACQSGIVLGLKNDGTVTLYAETYGQNSFDNCSNSDLSMQIHIVGQAPADEIVFDCSQVGTHDICLIVTDCSGNQDLCFSTVTIQDKRDPFIKKPNDITIACHNDNGGVPNHGGIPVVLPFSQVDFDSYDQSTGQNAAAGLTGAAQGWDNCGGVVTFTDVSTQGSDPTMCDYYSYTVTRTWTVTDPAGNDLDFDGNSETQIITVEDVEAPFFTETDGDLDHNINCDDPNFAARLSLAMAEVPTPNDLCYVTMEELPSQTIDGQCGTYNSQEKVFERLVRTWRATDACGNFTDYVQYINFFDVAGPMITCPNDGVPGTFYTSNGASATDCFAEVNLLASATDCQDVTWSHEIFNLTGGSTMVFSGGAFQFTNSAVAPGSYCAKFTATDPCGNFSECLYLFTVVDDSAPSLTCDGLPDDDADASNGNSVSIGSDAGFCGATYSWTHPNLGDNCGADLYCDLGDGNGASVVSSGSVASAFLPVGTTTVTYFAQDEVGLLSAMCSFDITVLDVESPSITCPAVTAITLYTSQDGFANYTCDVQYNWKSPMANDNCDVDSYTMQIGLDPATATYFDESHNYDFPLGTTAVTYTATDAEGNSSSCVITVTVIDDEDPVTLCQDATVELDASGTATIAAADVDGGSYDNCTASMSVSPTAFTCAELGENTVTLTVTDAAGNSFWCDAIVTVEDNIEPTIADCADQTAAAIDGTCHYIVSGTDWDASATDNCSASVTNDYTGTATLDGASFPTGSTSVIWTATDAAGNAVTCTQEVFISNEDLEASCRDYVNTNTLTLGEDGTLTMSADLFSDNSGSACDDLAYAISVDNGATFAGNYTFTCADITNGTPLSIVLLVTDNATGETDACVAQMSLTDTPVLIDFGGCPGDLNLVASSGSCGADVSLPLPVVEGACPVITYSVDGGAFADADGSDVYFPIGTHTVDFAVTNASGDAAIILGSSTGLCSITVTITDDGSSVFGCTDALANNYNPAATCDDNSCVFGPVACVTVADLPYTEDFEGTTGQWSQEMTQDDINWDLNSGVTPTAETGPSGAASGDEYAYIEASYPNYSSTAMLNSPCFDLLSSQNSSFSFAYNMNGEGVGTLSLELSVDGSDYTPVWSLSGDQGSEWHQATIDLSAYDDEMLVLRFEGETTNEYEGDIAIDQFGFDAQEAPETCEGDITGNGVVDINDFVALNSVFGTACTDCVEDLTNDGFVNVDDFLALNSSFGFDCSNSIVDPTSSLAELVLDNPAIELNKDLELIIRDMAELSFIVYPNPTVGDHVNIHINDFVGLDEEVVIQVRDVSGRVLTSERLIGTETGITHQIAFTDRLASGVYMMVVESNGKAKTKRFTVE